MSRETIDGLDGNGLQILLKRYDLSMEDKVAADFWAC